MDREKLHTTEAFHNRKTQIEDCLYKKLLNTPYNVISVSDLCNDVGISRRAFYHYFEDKDACLCSMIDRFFRSYMLEVASIPKDIPDKEKAVRLMKIWCAGDSNKFFDIFERNALLETLVGRAIRFAREEDRKFSAPFSDAASELDDDILCTYVASDLALLMRWYRRGFDTSPEEMAEKYMCVISKFG